MQFLSNKLFRSCKSRDIVYFSKINPCYYYFLWNLNKILLILTYTTEKISKTSEKDAKFRSKIFSAFAQLEVAAKKKEK